MNTENIFTYKDCFAEVENVPTFPIMESWDESLLFTFAIPTYNRPETLDETLQSILNQNSSIKYNIIISDNNPERDDSTEKLIKDKYNQIPRLSYYKNSQNLHSHGNWNRLVLLCRTKYMILIHDDDLLFENFLDNIQKMQEHFPNAAAINVAKQRWNGDNSVKPNISNKKYRVLSNTTYTNFAFFGFGAPTGCLFNVKDVKETGGFNAVIGPSFDYSNAITMCLQGKEVLNYKKPLILYRCVNNASSDMRVQYLQVDGDNLMRRHLAEILNLPMFYVRFVCWLKTKIRLRGINKKEPLLSYKGYTPGGSLFMIVYKLFSWGYVDIWVNRMHCIAKL